MNTVEIHFEGVPQVKAMLAEFSPRQLQNKMRRAVRAGAKVFGGGLKSTAQSHHGGAGNVPLSFQKVPAPKVSTHTEGGTGVEAYVRPKSPLFNVFQPGAKRHTIRPKRRGELKGPAGTNRWDSVGRKRAGAFFAQGPVSHPGMSDRDILSPAFQAKLPEAIDAVVGVLFDHKAFTSVTGNQINLFFP